MRRARGRRASRGCVAAALIALACARAPAAHASPATKIAEAPAPAAPELIPPTIVTEVAPEYPEGATSAARVIVEIVVGVDGAALDAKVVSGEPPFAEAALAAARRYRFRPATRGGAPVRARIRVEVDFTVTSEPARPGDVAKEQETAPPSPPASAEPSAGRDAPPPGSPPPRPALQITTAPAPALEVRVLGRREAQSPTEHRMKRAEMRVVPGAFGDPFRAIDMLPSVVPIISGLPYFYIRGAPPSAVGYYVDEVRVPYLFHFALGPGVIQPTLIEEVALHPAAFPGRFGRYAGGIVAGSTRDPATELHGEAQLRVFDAGAYVETPFANGRASAGVGGRYSYTAGIFSLLAPDVTIDYRDYNARATYQLSDRVRVSAFAFGSYDYASQIDEETRIEEVFFASEFHRLDLRLDRRGEDSTTRVAATVGLDRTRIEGARFAQDLVTGVRARHRWDATRALEIELGADVMVDHYAGDLPSPYAVQPDQYEQAALLFSPRTDTASGAWASATYRPRPGWDVTATMRGDAFTSAGKVAVGPSPRLSTKIPLTSRLAFLAALGVAPQPPAFAFPIPAVGYSGLPGGLSFGYQKSAGLSAELPLRFTLKTVGFHHSYFNLRDFTRDRSSIDLDALPPDPGGPSQAYGLEASLSRKLSERYAAFTTFTLSRSQLGATTAEPATVSPFDRTYVFQIGGVVDLGRGWRASSRFLTYGGWPREPDATGRPPGRLPAFYRVDLRVEKRWTLGKAPPDGGGRWISLVLEGLNVTASREIIGRSCTSESTCRDQRIGPIVVPSIGAEAGL